MGGCVEGDRCYVHMCAGGVSVCVCVCVSETLPPTILVLL